MRHRAAIATLVAVLGGGIASATAAAAPSISDGSVSPVDWSSSPTVGVLWTQNELTGWPFAATVEVNSAPDGSASGEWVPRFTAPPPLMSGPNGTLAMDVSDLEGRRQVRVSVLGAEGSPLTLGTLQLDRTPPAVSNVTFRVDGGDWRFFWDHADALSGIDPEVPTLVERNISPNGDEAGEWVPFTTQPPPGDAVPGRFAVQSGAGLAPGLYRSRVTATDRAGNVGVTPLGVVDFQPPVFTDVRLVKAPTVADQGATLEFTVSDGAGVGVDPGATVYVYRKGASTYTGFASAGDGRIRADLRDEGDFELILRVRDRGENVGESAPVPVQVRLRSGSTTGRPEVPKGVRRDPVQLFAARERPPSSASTRWAVRAVRRFHTRRGVRFTARVSAARTREQWEDLLGTREARRYVGYATFDNEMLLGPSVTAGLGDLRAWRLRDAAKPLGWRRPTLLERRRMATALAVLLHESLHVTGPRAREDFRLTPSGRAFEEGITEAATVDLLPDFARSLGGSARFQRALQSDVKRYRPAYRRQVRVVRDFSIEATKQPPASAAARRWRITVADTWGRDRWARLEQATLLPERRLRAKLARPPASSRHR